MKVLLIARVCCDSALLAQTNVAQFIAVCSPSILSETLGVFSSFLRESRAKGHPQRGAGLYA